MKHLLTVCAMLLAFSFAKAENKVGYVDLQAAVQSTKAGKEAKEKLEKEFKAKEVDFKKKEDELKKRYEELEKKAAVLSEDARQKQGAELQKEMLKFRQTVSQSQQDINTKERTMTQPILEQMAKIIADMAKKEGYSMIFEKRETLLWASPDADLTQKVAAEFEKNYKKK
jgi:outer membrane protein